MGIQMGSEGVMMKHSRSDESQADAVGTVILYKAGYNPQSMADFFKILTSQGGDTPPEFFSSHPNPGNREQAIQKQIKNWPAQTYNVDPPAFAEIRQHAAGVQAYNAEQIAQGAKTGQWTQLNQSTGAVRNLSGGSVFPVAADTTAAPKATAVSLEAVAPSRKTVDADLGPMKMQRPDNWLLKLPGQQGQFVQIAPKAGVTGGGVGYGLLLNGLTPQQAQGVAIDEATAKLIEIMQKDSGLQPVSKPEPITVGSIEGRSVQMQSTSPFPDANGQPQQEHDWLITIPQRNGALIFMIFVAPEANFAQLQPAYQAMLKSMQFK
jgi:hypothetical protein